MNERIQAINSYLTGWVGYFALADAQQHLEEIEGWLRRRFRMYFLKQWKRSRTRLTRVARPRAPREGLLPVCHLSQWILAYGWRPIKSSPEHRLLAGPGLNESNRTLPRDL
ncbi:MAG: group II intron maturase-specific domain-containing protein [Bacillota bacterium]